MRELLSFLSLVRTIVLLLSFAGRSSALSQSSPCYFPDGVIASGNYPCFLDQKQSVCCAAGAICEASGLCKVSGSVGVSDLLRGSCTDSTWASPRCPLYCTDADSGGTNLISCQNVTDSNIDFCCDHTDGCCDSGIGRFQVQLNTDVLTLGSSGATISTSVQTSTSTSSAATITSSRKTSSSSSSSRSTSTSAIKPKTSSSAATNTAGSDTSSLSKASSGLSTGTEAGIGVGCAIVALALLGGLGYYFKKRNYSKAPDYSVEKDGSTSAHEIEGSNPAELMANDGNGRNDRAELSA